MIKTKSDLKYYLLQDKKALGIKSKSPRFLTDYIWKYEIFLRKAEYYYNNAGVLNKVKYMYYKLRLSRTGRKNGGFGFPLNCVGPGLSIAHYGNIVINNNAKIGKNLRIQEGVTIGAKNGSHKAAKIGDNVYIGSGAKIIGDVIIGSGATIGANAVVTKSFPENNCVLAGVPAKKIKEDKSKSNLNQLLFK